MTARDAVVTILASFVVVLDAVVLALVLSLALGV